MAQPGQGISKPKTICNKYIFLIVVRNIYLKVFIYVRNYISNVHFLFIQVILFSRLLLAFSCRRVFIVLFYILLLYISTFLHHHVGLFFTFVLFRFSLFIIFFDLICLSLAFCYLYRLSLLRPFFFHTV